MHYYQFNIADYRKDTAHLSLMEHAIYRQLLDWYYLDEKPIPTETHWVIRRFQVPFEQVETILKEFFELQQDGWHHERCDIEINNYKHNAEKNRRNGRLGGRPKKTHSVILANPNETQTKGNQEPITNNQEPVTIESTTLSGKPDASPPINGSRAKAIELLEFLNMKTGKRFRPVDATLKPIAARLKEFELQELKSMISMKAREWGQDEKMSDYLRPMTLFAASNCANYVGQLHMEE
jgi:uncharacterized phage protein (TIGR02220 family)